jgi:hypothetical protein
MAKYTKDALEAAGGKGPGTRLGKSVGLSLALMDNWPLEY